MHCLELFAGTGSVGRAFEQLGWEVVSLDIDPKCGATHVADILSWDHRVYPRGHFHFVWASPVCTHYIIARTTGGPRDLLSADRLVRRALDVVEYFGCHWAMENPQTGLLKTRDIVRGLPFFDTSYCKYGYPYRKHTRIWSSLALRLCSRCFIRDPCSFIVGIRHPTTVQLCSRSQSYSIPPTLCDAIAGAANLAVEQTDVTAPSAGTLASAPVRQTQDEL